MHLNGPPRPAHFFLLAQLASAWALLRHTTASFLPKCEYYSEAFYASLVGYVTSKTYHRKAKFL